MQETARSIFAVNLNRLALDTLQLADTNDYYTTNNNKSIMKMQKRAYFCDQQCYIYLGG